jgi:hypothetical protein
VFVALQQKNWCCDLVVKNIYTQHLQFKKTTYNHCCPLKIS